VVRVEDYFNPGHYIGIPVVIANTILSYNRGHVKAEEK
jgi:hypothetical protein